MSVKSDRTLAAGGTWTSTFCSQRGSGIANGESSARATRKQWRESGASVATANSCSPDPKIRREVPTLEAFARALHRRLRAGEPSEAERRRGKGVDLRVHLIPALGLRTLDTISNEQVQQLKSRLHNKAPKTVNNVLSLLNVLLKQAVEWAPARPAALFDPTCAGAANGRGLPRLRCLRAVAEAAADDRPAELRHRAPRRGGRLAGRRDRRLEWADVDFERRQIRVRHSTGAANCAAEERAHSVRRDDRTVGDGASPACGTSAPRRVLCKDDGTPLTRQGAWSRVRYAAKRREGADRRSHPASHVLLAPGDARRTDARRSGARRASEPRDDAAVLAPESCGSRRDDPAARKPHDVAASWRQFGDAEEVKRVTRMARTR